jgi:SH3-like domain-containing protein
MIGVQFRRRYFMFNMVIATQNPRSAWWMSAALSAVCLSAGFSSSHAAGGEVGIGSASGLPLPRYVSLKSDRVNVRGGPTKDHDVAWVFTRSGLPVEITAEFENWRRIRDSEGAEGWVYHSLLSGRRTAVVTQRGKDEFVPLNDSPDVTGSIRARLQPGVVASVRRCDGHWCRIAGEGFDGWIRQERLWGVYPDEKVD